MPQTQDEWLFFIILAAGCLIVWLLNKRRETPADSGDATTEKLDRIINHQITFAEQIATATTNINHILRSVTKTDDKVDDIENRLSKIEKERIKFHK